MAKLAVKPSKKWGTVEIMAGTRKDSGRKGGLATLKRHGKKQLAAWGKLGGRPRNEVRK